VGACRSNFRKIYGGVVFATPSSGLTTTILAK
jgi:hypothetical protein